MGVGAEGLGTAGNARSEPGVLAGRAGGASGSGSESQARANVEPTARAPSRCKIAPVWHSMVPSEGAAMEGGEVGIGSTFGRGPRGLREKRSHAAFSERPDGRLQHDVRQFDVTFPTQPTDALPYPSAS